MSDLQFPCLHIGEFTVTAISDGNITADLSLLSNIEPKYVAEMEKVAGIKESSTIHINCYLIRGRGHTVLIDAGAGGFKQWGGLLEDNLSKIGVHPHEIDTILLTHAHPDHVAGLLNKHGNPIFSNAELVIHQQEIEFWQNDGNLSRANERTQGNFLIARQVFEKYRDQLRLFKGGDVSPGLTAMPLLGHTAGHTGYRLESKGQNLLIWGDIVHFPEIQIPRPDVSIAFDLDPLLAAKTRTTLLDLAHSEQLLIAGMHLRERGFGHIKRKETGYTLVYENPS
ncbi:MBL fold metallo-hydrolase [Saccharibacter sp. 17.LH.SD]|nr:MBL fold metallo-hydrolase [Saccharibacter sp. 17.LH.SD]